MATRAEAARATATKKGVAKKRAKKLSQRKPAKTNRVAPKLVKAPRTKRDTAAVLAHEAEANAPERRAALAIRKAKRVRGSVRS